MKMVTGLSKIIGGVAFFIFAVFVFIAIGKLLPQSTQVLSPANRPGDAYPPPATIEPTQTPTLENYPPPGKSELPTITPTWDKTSRPPGWPTQLPWPLPSPATPMPMPTKTPIIFPTPDFPAAPEGKRPNSLQQLWYVYADNSNSQPILQNEQIDDAAQRWGQGQFTLDIGLEQGYPGRSLTGLFPSPDGKWMVALAVYDVRSQAYLINLSDGKTERFLSNTGDVRVLGWKPDSQSVIVMKEASMPWEVGEVNIVSGEYVPIEFPKNNGALPVVDAIAFSPDGKFMADAVEYHRGKDYLLSIGIWDTGRQERKTIQEITPGNEVSARKLTWSTDGQFLLWTSYSRVTNDDPSSYLFQSEMWSSNMTTEKSKSKLTYEGDSLPLWSPDGKQIAVVIANTEDKSNSTDNIYLINPDDGTKTQISHFKNMRLNNLQWSLDGRMIFCNANSAAGAVSGVIWAVNVDNGDMFPVAGPVIGGSPYLILH